MKCMKDHYSPTSHMRAHTSHYLTRCFLLRRTRRAPFRTQSPVLILPPPSSPPHPPSPLPSLLRFTLRLLCRNHCRPCSSYAGTAVSPQSCDVTALPEDAFWQCSTSSTSFLPSKQVFIFCVIRAEVLQDRVLVALFASKRFGRNGLFSRTQSIASYIAKLNSLLTSYGKNK